MQRRPNCRPPLVGNADNPFLVNNDGLVVRSLNELLAPDLPRCSGSVRTGKENIDPLLPLAAARERRRSNTYAPTATVVHGQTKPKPRRRQSFFGPPSTIIQRTQLVNGKLVTLSNAEFSNALALAEAHAAYRMEGYRVPSRRLTNSTVPGATRIRFGPLANAAARAAVRMGYRLPRQVPLTDHELYLGARRPQFLTTVHRHLECTLCKGIKSHPVMYRCGHGHCYVCARKALENNWKCPDCPAEIQERPVIDYPSEDAIARAHPERMDRSFVTYSWDGLIFPEPRIVPSSP
ncbi:hypothetical protein DFH07DRAFT_780484 [Mycena maculata]|uniref:RING-type domain-containing protein n=1 Tax=Mycena maculata TaxID=230809 RepID=A0AAD7I4M2_9AGAR|nr:hypothetical protein DFH07DRAFT_780484 [Mycena maculata]